jgi:hypothetical protein
LRSESSGGVGDAGAVIIVFGPTAYLRYSSTGGRGLAVRIVPSSQFIKVGESSEGLNEGNLHLDAVVGGGL